MNVSAGKGLYTKCVTEEDEMWHCVVASTCLEIENNRTEDRQRQMHVMFRWRCHATYLWAVQEL